MSFDFRKFKSLPTLSIIEGILFVFFLIAFINLNNAALKLDANSLYTPILKEIKGTLSKDPEYFEGRHRRRHRDHPSMYLSLTEYPKISFRVPFAEDLSFIKDDIGKQDSIFIKVDTKDIELISKTNKKTSVNSEIVYVYEIYDPDYYYMSIDDYKELKIDKELSQNSTLRIVCIIFLIIIIGRNGKKVLQSIIKK